MSTRACVALIRTTPETVIQDYARAMELAEFRRYLDPAAKTTLALDVRRHFPFPAANSPPWQPDGAARALRAAGYCDLACARLEAPIAGTFKGHDLDGYLPVLRANGITADSPGVAGQSGDDPPGANIMLLPTLKADSATTIGGALRCLFGALSPRRARVAHGHLHELLADRMAVQRARSAGMFALMDGTTAGDGPGPYRLQPEVKNAILASGDPVALDAVAAALMGFDPLRDVEFLRLAHARGLGVGDPRQIALVGDAELAGERWMFSAGSGWRGIIGLPRQICMRGPLAGRLAHVAQGCRDYYRWRFVDRRVFEAWLRGTQWGRLFARYQRAGIR